MVIKGIAGNTPASSAPTSDGTIRSKRRHRIGRFPTIAHPPRDAA